MEGNDLGKTSTGINPTVAGLLSYLLGFVTGIIFLVIEKENRFVRFHAATGNFLDGRLVPVRLANGGMPEIDFTDEAIRLIKDLTATDIKPRSIIIEDNGVIRPLSK